MARRHLPRLPGTLHGKPGAFVYRERARKPRLRKTGMNGPPLWWCDGTHGPFLDTCLFEAHTSYMLKNFQYRIYPTKKQQRTLDTHLEECRLLYNHLLEMRKTAYERANLSLPVLLSGHRPRSECLLQYFGIGTTIPCHSRSPWRGSQGSSHDGSTLSSQGDC